jgi:hypothetical protein
LHTISVFLVGSFAICYNIEYLLEGLYAGILRALTLAQDLNQVLTAVGRSNIYTLQQGLTHRAF